MDDDQLLERGREILDIEAAALARVQGNLGDPFVAVVRVILALRGKVVVTGVGKSGYVGQKIAATLSSTGTPAVFLHPVEGMHGDLGVVQEGDLVLALSNSGETEEVLNVVAAAKQRKLPVAALVGRPGSTLAAQADWALDASVDREACPLGLAPTASTTAALALGDAVAMVLEEARGFTADDFAEFHPGGSLGQRLAARVRDLMRKGERLPLLTRDRSLRDAIDEMTVNESIGIALVVDADGALQGVLTDGDLRRILHSTGAVDQVLDDPVERFMSPNPQTIETDAPASEALQLMESKGITSLAVVDSRSRPIGLIHLHDVLGRGQVTIK